MEPWSHKLEFDNYFELMAFNGSSLSADIIGFLGGILISIGPMAQLYKVIKTDKTDDISFKWMTLYLIGMAGSLTYSIHYENYPILIPAVLETLIILTIFLIKAKRIVKESAPPDNPPSSVVPDSLTSVV